MNTIEKLENDILIQCPVCDNPFIRSLEHKKYCSTDCSKVARRQRTNKSSRIRYHKNKYKYKRCKWCGSETHIDKRYAHNCCSDVTCVENHKKWKRKIANEKSYIKKRGKTNKQKRLDAETSKKYRQNNRVEINFKKRWRKQQKADWIENFKKQHPCKRCNDNRFFNLDFHHLNPDEKEHKLSEMARQEFSINKIQAEISKCCVLCSNCHREFHYLNKTTGINFEEWIKPKLKMIAQ